MTVKTDQDTSSNQKISFQSGGSMIFKTPLVDYSDQSTMMKLKSNTSNALKVTDGTDDIFKIDTSPSNASNIALTVGTSGSIVMSTPKLDLTGKETAVHLIDNSMNAFVLTDGSNAMMTVKTDQDTSSNQKISFQSGGSMIFKTPLVDYSDQSTMMKLKSNTANALKITDGASTIVDFDTSSMSLTFSGSAMKMQSQNITLDASA